MVVSTDRPDRSARHLYTQAVDTGAICLLKPCSSLTRAPRMRAMRQIPEHRRDASNVGGRRSSSPMIALVLAPPRRVHAERQSAKGRLWYQLKRVCIENSEFEKGGDDLVDPRLTYRRRGRSSQKWKKTATGYNNVVGELRNQVNCVYNEDGVVT